MSESRESAVVQQEQLPAGYFDKLVTTIQDIGRVAMPEMIAQPMAPSYVSGYPIRVGALALELRYRFGHLESDGTAVPTEIRSVLSECAPYAPIDGAEIWGWTQLDLNLRRRRRAIEHGISIVSSEGEISLNDDLPLDHPRRRGTKLWQRTRSLTTKWTVADYESYVSGLGRILTGITSGDREA